MPQRNILRLVFVEVLRDYCRSLRIIGDIGLVIAYLNVNWCLNTVNPLIYTLILKNKTDVHLNSLTIRAGHKLGNKAKGEGGGLPWCLGMEALERERGGHVLSSLVLLNL